MTEEYPIIYDTYYKGGVDLKGNLRQVWNKEALENAIKMWIVSMQGEVIRQPRKGGYVTELLMKPINQVQEDYLIKRIRNGIKDEFRPYLEIQKLTVKPDYEKRTWHITLEVYSPELKIDAIVSEKLKTGI